MSRHKLKTSLLITRGSTARSRAFPAGYHGGYDKVGTGSFRRKFWCQLRTAVLVRCKAALDAIQGRKAAAQ